MAVQWTTMTSEITAAETLVRYTICHDMDAKFTFRVTVELMGATVHISLIKEDYMGDMCTIVRVYYITDLDIQVSMTWV